MSKLSTWTKKNYKQSGLRKFYENNKSAILNTAAIAAVGATGGLSAVPLSGATMIGGGLAAGMSQDKRRKEKIARANELDAANAQKTQASDELDKLLEGVTGGTPGSLPGKVTGQPVFTGGEPPIDPNTGIPSELSPAGGMTQTGGQASTDQNRLLAEAEAQKKMKEEFASLSKAEKEKALQDYAQIISTQQNRLLDENNPKLMEDLNTRGLLRSSELGNAMGVERGKAAAILQEQVEIGRAHV